MNSRSKIPLTRYLDMTSFVEHPHLRLGAVYDIYLRSRHATGGLKASLWKFIEIDGYLL